MVDAAVDIRTHFGLTATPFTRELPIEKRFKHGPAEQALQALRFTVQQRMSATLLAPAGCGKTVLLRALRDQLPDTRFRVSYVKVASLGKRAFCRELSTVIGCQTAGQYNTLVRNIQAHLRGNLHEGLSPVLLVDEAHDMAPEVLAILRVLTNFDMDSRLVLSVILAGQPRLGTTLKRPDLEAVTGRMAHFATLRNLGREEMRSYVLHRMTIAGARQSLFSDSALDALFELGRGNYRATDTLAFKALCLAAARGDSTVDSDHLLLARAQVLP